MKVNCNSFTANTIIKKNISLTVDCEGYNSEIADVVKNLFDYMVNRQLFGGCHALTSVMFVALNELGYKPKLLVGECYKNGTKPFDHSWVELDNKIIDLAIYYPLTLAVNSISGPIVFGYDMLTMKTSSLNYGINTGLPFSVQTINAMNRSITEYMNNYPMEKGGLWRVLEMVYPNNNLNIQSLKNNYLEIYREIVR